MDYIETTLIRTVNVKSIISIHYFEYPPMFSFDGEAHDFWELVFCDKGALDITAGNNRLRLERGQMYVHPPMQFHNIGAANENSANSVILSFKSDADQLWEICDRVIDTDNFTVTALFSVLREARASFSNLQGKVYDSMLTRKNESAIFASEQMIQCYMELLLINLVRLSRSVSPLGQVPNNATDNALLSSIVEYMRQSMAEDISFSDICAKFSISPTTLKKLFSKAFGHGAMAHLTKLRIERAKELLREGTLSCTDIASACGFCSVHHFSGVFKRLEGMPPTDYTKTVKALLEYNG